MKEKLSQAEIEEHKKQNILENAKINSFITGIPLSDLIDSSSKRVNYGEKDCLVKQLYLKNLVEPITSRELFEALKRQGYDAKYTTFCGLLNRYQDYGYVEKKTLKKPFLFGLTDEGIRHIKNPYLAREELARKRMNFIYSQIEKELVDHPEALKALLESITQMNIGSPIGSNVIDSNSGNYNANDIGSNEELMKEINTKITDSNFWKNIDYNKIEQLITTATSGKLTDEESELLADIVHQATNSNKGSMIINREHNPSKPVGLRKYYTILVKAENRLVSKSTYESLPFRFIKVGNELRIRSQMESGLYEKNKDAIEVRFELVNNIYFYNRMSIIMKYNQQKKEYLYYYAVVDGKGNCGFALPITTISYNDYEKVQKQIKGEMKLKIISQK